MSKEVIESIDKVAEPNGAIEANGALETKVEDSKTRDGEAVADPSDKTESDTVGDVSKDDIVNVKSTINTLKLSDDQATKLAKLIKSLPLILNEVDNKDYDEIFGYRINVDSCDYVDIPIRNEILLKFLIANEYDVSVTKDKLVQTLNWRNEFQPLSAAFDETYDVELGQLGVITRFPTGKNNLRIITWNLYGNLKTPKKLFEKFGDSTSSKPGSQFLRWRIGLMERSLALIDLTDAENHKIGQVHDYTGASFFRMDSGMKANTKEIITIFGDNYPELLSTKFFIGIPTVMSWMFSFVKSVGLISKETLKKFQVISGRDLSSFLSKDDLPTIYGGNKEKSLFDIKVLDAKVSEYGQILLTRLGEKQIAAVSDTVE